MKRLSIIVSQFVIGFSAFGCSQQMSGQSEPGWVTLLDGSEPKSLDTVFPPWFTAKIEEVSGARSCIPSQIGWAECFRL